MDAARKLPLILITGIVPFLNNSRALASGGWFDAAPQPSLAGDLDRLPAKTLGEILLETSEKGEADVAEVVDTDAVDLSDVQRIVDKIGKEKPEALAKQIDVLVMKARLHYVPKGGVLHELYDIRDAITSQGPSDEEKRDYWFYRGRKKIAVASAEEEDPSKLALRDPMRPHLLYLRGAMMFNEGDRDKARPWFAEIVKRYPDHPRAETGAFLEARCVLSMARTDDSDRKPEEKKKLWAEATQLFRAYLKKYPKGRYAADAHGWLGALLLEEHPAEALEEYILQLEDPLHPECRKSAAHMVERALSSALGSAAKDDAALQVVARHPRVALAAVYQLLNAPEIDPYDGKYDQPADLKKWRQTVLPKLASAVSAEEARYKGLWAPRFRAMLAQAASDAGKQEEALKLTAAPEAELKGSDDLLFARIVALQRAKQPREVAKLGQLFLDTFESSQLRAGVTLRLALALMDDHRAGEAYAMLCAIEKTPDARTGEGNDGLYPENEKDLDLAQSWIYPDTDGSNAFATLKETILNFAPLKELQGAAGHKVMEEKPDALGILRKTLLMRREALEDFAGAVTFTEDEAVKARLGSFQKLLQAVNDSKGFAKAQAMIALGDAFEEESNQRKEKNEEQDIGEPMYRSQLGQRSDALALGIADPDTELENGDPMRHATRWWLRAARTAPATELSAKARLKVLEGLEKIARANEYSFTRAIEVNLGQVSKDIYDILQKENPKSAAAHDAVYWDFVPCPKPKPKAKKEGEDSDSDDQPHWEIMGQPDPGREEDALSLLGGYRALHYNAFGRFASADGSSFDPEGQSAPDALHDILHKPQELAEYSNEQLAKDIELMRQQTISADRMSEVNYLLDILQLKRRPDISLETKKAYIRFRDNLDAGIHGEGETKVNLAELIKQAHEHPALAGVQDFVDYAEIYAKQAFRGSGYEDFHYPDYAEVEKACRAFLAKYPKSPKREACSLVLIRSLFRQLPDRFGHKAPGERHEHRMDDNRPVEELDERFEPGAMLKAIDAYEKEFPHGRYGAEIRNYRGTVAWRRFDYGAALDLTIAQLDDETHPDLRGEGAVRLANIFADLRDAKHRRAVLAALKARPSAVAKLKLYLNVAPEHANHPLRCMRRYLGDQLGFQ